MANATSDGPTPESVKLGPPPRWLGCPRRGELIDGKFLPFKTPLCDMYDKLVPDNCRFIVKMVFSQMVVWKRTMGLWIDLTNTSRFYSHNEVESFGAKYWKFNCRGYGECPSPEQTEVFIKMCKNYFAQHPDDVIGIHCTHGFNRTGFLISAYLATEQGWSIEAAVNCFAAGRPPGIYKQDYLNELFTRFGDADETPTAPALPDWCNNLDPVLDNNESEMTASTSQSRGFVKALPEFVPANASVQAVTSILKVRRLQEITQKICRSKSSKGFPGGQPVSMDLQNINFLAEKPYKVSWKADGIRYIMFIEGKNEVFMFDRDHNAFQVSGLTFPMREDSTQHLKNTLLDGEMVVDKVDGKEYPRYLIYDIVQIGKPDGTQLHIGSENFSRRLSCITHEIIEPRDEAKKSGLITAEPFSVRLKQFYDVTSADALLSERFKKQLAHESDGLVFQPIPDPYESGRTPSVLKWKPHHLNSVDFKLLVVREHKEGMLPELKGYLYVLGLDTPFSEIKVTKDLRLLDKKIIECSWENGQWKFLRQRTDKSFPNAFATAQGVCESIRNPVTQDFLLEFIKTRAAKPSSAASASLPSAKASGGNRQNNGPVSSDASTQRSLSQSATTTATASGVSAAARFVPSKPTDISSLAAAGSSNSSAVFKRPDIIMTAPPAKQLRTA